MKREPNARGSGDQLREQLVKAASELLLEPQGIALPSLRAVARACQVSPAAVYLHFDSQQALLSAVLESHLDSLARYLEQAVLESGAEPMARVAAFTNAYAEWGMSHPGAYQLLFESADQLGAAHNNGDDRNELLEVAAELLAAAAPPVDPPERAASRLWAGMHGIVSLRIHKASQPWPPLAEEVLHLLSLHGVAGAGR